MTLCLKSFVETNAVGTTSTVNREVAGSIPANTAINGVVAQRLERQKDVSAILSFGQFKLAKNGLQKRMHEGLHGFRGSQVQFLLRHEGGA